MKRVKNISLAWVVIPLLYTGCMQDNISKIQPNINIDNNSSKSKNLLTEKNITKTSSSGDISTFFVDESNPLVQDELEKNSINIPKVISIDDSSDIEMATTINRENLVDDRLAILNENNYFAPTIEEIEDNWIALSKEDEIIETAKSFLGTKYVWAANGPNAFDCSGFTKYVFREIGIELPRYSGHQAKVGITVDFDELQKGDLVFFDTEHKFRGKVNHVGIYIGDNKFIHASSANKQVTITSFSEKPFYKRRFLKGERVINIVDSSTYASL
jgi:cell wall-associated NlpC family hydrolase